ncbi:CSL zinc finger-domain-containing protein [Coniochaeta sp. 2T2.1]|nr:CSL zinc finger-domain-containing protein [Coniochaeta sp. 2T2.1]
MAASFPTPNGATTQQSYYEILSLTPEALDSSPNLSQTLKRAYHRALLIHHPDKRKRLPPSSSRHSSPPPSGTGSSITVDRISLAYATLSSTSLRSKYDALLLSSPTSPLSQQGNTAFQTGIENIDLDDLDFDEEKQEWYRSCRCGNDRGHRFSEADLEEAGELGEVMVGCADCSLWLRVGFAVVDEADEGDEGEGEGGREQDHEGNGKGREAEGLAEERKEEEHSEGERIGDGEERRVKDS